MLVYVCAHTCILIFFLFTGLIPVSSKGLKSFIRFYCFCCLAIKLLCALTNWYGTRGLQIRVPIRKYCSYF